MEGFIVGRLEPAPPCPDPAPVCAMRPPTSLNGLGQTRRPTQSTQASGITRSARKHR